MDENLPRKAVTRKLLILTLAIIISAPLILLVILNVNFNQKQDEVLTYYSQQPNVTETFTALTNLTQPDSTILCWWDYGRPIQQWSHRRVIEAYPSRDIWYTMGSSRDPILNLETQIFGTWGDSQKIHDLARILTYTEDQALPIMRSYNVTYALVFTPDDLQKFYWIADIAGLKGEDYLTVNGTDYQPTLLGSQTTLLRLLFDETLHPVHFQKLFDNSRGRIFQIQYPPAL